MAKKREKEEELITIKKITQTSSKKSTKKRAKKSASPAPKNNENMERLLIENFVSLQGVMANLSIRFDDLSRNISRLLEIFEKASATLLEKDLTIREIKTDERQNKDLRDVVDGLNKLLEQNKIIARGLVLLHENNPVYRAPPMAQIPQQQMQQFMPPAESSAQKEQDSGNYQKSISSETKNA